MRPARLEMEGFATFRNRTVLEFDGLDLVAFTGPTGSGKSTVIDAITFALYGSVARYDNPNLVAPVIHQLVNEAKVRLDFDLGGSRYTAVRIVRRTKSGASTREARLERVEVEAVGDGEGEVTTLAGTVTELDGAVVALLGLTFDQFTRTIVLPQGDFAQFLRDEPANRQKLLRRLLDLEIFSRMGSVAREEAKRAGQQLEAVRPERDRIVPVDKAELVAAEARRAALVALRTTVGLRLDEMAAVEAELVPLRERCLVIDAARERLDTIAVPVEAANLGVMVDGARSRQEAAVEALNTARSVRDEAQEAVEKAGDRARLAETLSALRQRDEAGAELAEAKGRAETVLAALAGLQEKAAKTAVERDEARAALSEVRAQADAASWTATLEVGRDCPVCHRPVTELPDHDADAELAQATARAERADAEADEAHRLATAAQADHRAVVETVARLETRLERLDSALAEGADDKALTVVELEAAIETARRAEGAKAEADARVRDCEKAVAGADKELQAATNLTASLRQRLDQTRDRVAELSPPVTAGESLVADWETLTGWAAQTGEDLAAEREELAATGKRLAENKKTIDAALRTEAAAVGIEAPAEAMVEALATASAQAAAALSAMEERAANRERLDRQVGELEETEQVNAALGLQLKADRFEGWLLDEALGTIVDRATEWLLELSRGQYSLAVSDRQFAIIDHTNADDRRDVRTLSGGETFLASLALALALADSVAELAPVDAPRLESMFLDEGFGTLDPETLDVVAAAIEELAATGRMIGIVTHVADLAERMPARFEIRKQATGSTAELVTI